MAPKKKNVKKKASKKNTPNMFNLEEVKEFIKFFDKSDVKEIEIQTGENTLYLNKNSEQPAANYQPFYIPQSHQLQAAPNMSKTEKTDTKSIITDTISENKDQSGPVSNLLEIKSPIVGTFYRSPAPDASAFVEVGSSVSKGSVVCIIEAMKIMNEIESEFSGTIKEVCVDNEQPVEFGQVLFKVEPK